MRQRLRRSLFAMVMTLAVISGLFGTAVYAQSWNVYNLEMYADWDLQSEGDATFYTSNNVYWANNTTDSVDLDVAYQYATLLSADNEPVRNVQFYSRAYTEGGSYYQTYVSEDFTYYVDQCHLMVSDYYEYGGPNSYLTAGKVMEAGVSVKLKTYQGEPNYHGHVISFYGMETYSPGVCRTPISGLNTTVTYTSGADCPF